MKKKVLIAAIIVAVLLLGACGHWLYWEREFSLSTQLPDGPCHSLSLIGTDFNEAEGNVDHVSYQVNEEVTQTILTALKEANVSRRPSSEELVGEIFWITLCMGNDHDMFGIYLSEGGQLDITGEGDWHYYEGCEELYQQIRTHAEKLPINEIND